MNDVKNVFFAILIIVGVFWLFNTARDILGGVNPTPAPAVVYVTQIVPIQGQEQSVIIQPVTLPTQPASVPVNVMAEPTWTPFYVAPDYTAPTAEMNRGGWPAPTLGTGHHVPGRTDRRSTSVP